MRDAIVALGTTLILAALLVAAVYAVRWAKRGSPATQLMASAMMLVLGMIGPAVKPPEQGIEEAREDKGKKGSESGDPPAQ